jgi:hypothetical protein
MKLGLSFAFANKMFTYATFIVYILGNIILNITVLMHWKKCVCVCVCARACMHVCMRERLTDRLLQGSAARETHF